MRIAFSGSITEEHLLADLNGSAKPYGLQSVYRRYFGSVLQAPPSSRILDAYESTLREAVDPWLSHRRTLETLRLQKAERQEIGAKIRVVDDEWQRTTSELNQLRKQQNKAATRNVRRRHLDEATLELAKKWESLQAEYKALNERLNTARTPQKQLNSDRQVALRISAIVEYVASGHQLLPTSGDDGYGFLIKPSDALINTSTTPWKWGRSGIPKSKVDRSAFASDEEHFLALYQEQFAKLQERAKTKPLNEELSQATTGAGVDSDLWQPRKAAWLVFTEMLVSEWSARIAKCAEPGCVEPYFRLGKWNTDTKAALCLSCRTAKKRKHRQARVERDRKDAENAVFGFVAAKFRDRIRPDSDWYEDKRLQAEIADAVNAFIRKSSPAIQNRYRGKVSPRWITSERKGRSNFSRVENIVKAERRAHAKANQ